MTTSAIEYYGTPDDALLTREVVVAFTTKGRYAGDGDWRNQRSTLEKLVSRYFSHHWEGEKDGSALTQGELDDRHRMKSKVRRTLKEHHSRGGCLTTRRATILRRTGKSMS
jgi:hypothetical protein